tara:strand:- start:1223 stop:2308 length:1086 start_codon:yes stop_codon:yes gene_type:complete
MATYNNRNRMGGRTRNRNTRNRNTIRGNVRGRGRGRGRNDVIYINEFSSKDRLFPGLGDSSDWVELYNPNAYDVSLAGWNITDDGDYDFMDIPAGVSVPANGFLLVMFNDCVDGDDENDDPIPVPCITQQCVEDIGPPCFDGTYLHVPTKLGGSDGIQLFNQDGNLVDEIYWDGHLVDSDNCSYARITDGGNWGEERCDGDLIPPTPGTTNNSAPGPMMGDWNQDGVVNVVDVVQVVNHVLSGTPATELQLELADYNIDGVINVVDLVQMVNDILGPQSSQGQNLINRVRRLGKSSRRGVARRRGRNYNRTVNRKVARRNNKQRRSASRATYGKQQFRHADSTCPNGYRTLNKKTNVMECE